MSELEKTPGQVLTDAEAELVRANMFGSAKMNVKSAQGTSVAIYHVKPDLDHIRQVYDVLTPLYQREFGMSLLSFSRLNKAIRDGYSARESTMLRVFIHGEQRSLLLGYDGSPSISFGLNPPTRLHVEDIALMDDESRIVVPD